MKKVSILIVLLLLISLVGCNDSGEAAQEDALVDELKVAIVLSGPINDQAWNATGYDGLMKIEEKFGATVSYTESVAQSDMESAYMAYATQGYDVIFGHGFEFTDAASKVAENYPDTMFVTIAGYTINDTNLASLNVDNYEQGFLQGVVAGLVSETGIIGSIGGMEIPPIQESIEGYAAGARYVNPAIDVRGAYTGSFDDTARVKETALAMIDDGVDVIMADAGQAILGAIDAAEERNVYAVGTNYDQNDFAPNNVVTSGIDDLPYCMVLVMDEIIQGTFVPDYHVYGIREGAVYLSSFHGFAETLDPEILEEIEEIQASIKNGDFDTHSVQ
jgi:basic membrane protein A